MRRTVIIDDQLLDEAREALGTSSIRETVEQSLREMVRRRRLDDLRNSLGKIDLSLTAEELEKIRDAE